RWPRDWSSDVCSSDLYATQWEVVEAKADRNAAWVTSRLDFYRQPDWMAQFPFAHSIEMTYRLVDGALEVLTKLHNLSNEAMPVRSEERRVGKGGRSQF